MNGLIQQILLNTRRDETDKFAESIELLKPSAFRKTCQKLADPPGVSKFCNRKKLESYWPLN